MKKKYLSLAIFNILLGLVAICLYLPYTLEAFNMAGFEWFKFVPNTLKGNYYDVLIYFGLFLLLFFIISNFITLLSKVNIPKFLCKITVVIALALPFMYILALKNDTILKLWLKTIVPNIKMITYIVICVSCGNFVLALIYNFTHKNRANLHHLLEALVMCALLILMAICYNWCGWEIKSTIKIYGVLIGLLAMYLPISSLVLCICSRNRD